MKDLLGLGNMLPMKKLIEVISIGLGKVSKSYFDRKDVRTKAYEIEELAKANANALKTLTEAFQETAFNGKISINGGELTLNSVNNSNLPAEPETPLRLRSNTRQLYQEQLRQLNIEQITSIAAENLQHEPPITDESLDPDWINRFFSIAGDISTDQMQELWGRILAGEVKQPGSFSLRTLDVIKNLTRDEAKLFTDFARLRLYAEGECFVYHDEDLFHKDYRIKPSQIMLLADAGLIQPNMDIILNFKSIDQDSTKLLFRQGKKGILAEGPFNSLNHIEVLKFTVAGAEIAELIEESKDDFHFHNVCRAITAFSNVSVTFGKLNESKDALEDPRPFQKMNNNI